MFVYKLKRGTLKQLKNVEVLKHFIRSDELIFIESKKTNRGFIIYKDNLSIKGVKAVEGKIIEIDNLDPGFLEVGHNSIVHGFNNAYVFVGCQIVHSALVSPNNVLSTFLIKDSTVKTLDIDALLNLEENDND